MNAQVEVNTEVQIVDLNRQIPGMTPKEKEVCRFVVMGLNSKEIARELGINHRTVEDHRASIFRKAGVTGAASLVYKALGSPKVVA